jgi:UDP-glucose 4-epimerase
MKALVTGGAGYIGSVVAAQLLDAGHQVVVLDDLSRGHADAVPPGAERLVFSSTAATYGEPETVPIAEDQPPAPVNAYGASKLAVDLMIRDEARARRGSQPTTGIHPR